MSSIESLRSKELENCTFVKTVLMLLVIVYHSIVYWGGSWFDKACAIEAPALGVAANWLNSFLVQTFTFTSGYLFSYLKYERGKYAAFIPFVLGKVKRLLIPAVFIAAFWIIPFGFAFHGYTVADVIEKFVLCTSPSQLWFLWMLFFVFLLFWVLADVFGRHPFLGALIAVGCYGIGLIGQRFTANYFMIWTSCCYVGYFYLGLVFRRYDFTLLRRLPLLVWWVLQIGLFALSTFVLTGEGAVIGAAQTGCLLLSTVCGVYVAFLTFARLGAYLGDRKNNRVFSLFSRCSMPMYLFHQQLLYISLFYLNGVFNPYLHALLNIAGATSLSLLISCVMLRFKVTRFLIGEK